ncbi:MAG: type IV pilus assembly protein PilM [Acidimicrobiia bacterium]
MARRLIGLDIGTNAVRVAEIEASDPPRLTSFGQVALPAGAMRDGEVVDPAAVTAAVQRLWKELSLKKAPVRIGVASPRVLVRTVDLPTMSDAELAGALRFQAQELIPIPLEDAVLDFQVLEALPLPEVTGDGPPPQPMSRVLLAAAHRDLIRNLTGAVRAAGLTVASVDLVPLSLVRSVGRRVSDNGGGVEAIVSVGGGVTVVVVHELGIPRFVRILGSGGRAVTDAIARDLELTQEQAEAVKRGDERAPVDLRQRAQGAMARPISDLVEQIRGSLDYYRTQPDAIRLLRVTLTGGGSLTPGLADQLLDTVGVPVDLARPREHIAVGDIGFPDDQLPMLDPFLPVPVGLALGGLMSGKRIDLLGGDHKTTTDRGQLIKVGLVVGGVLVAGLAGLTYLKQKQVDDEKSKLAAAQARNVKLQHEIDGLSDVAQRQTQIEALSAEAQNLLATDVSWSTMLQAVSRTIPADVWLTSFQGSVTPAAATAAAAPTPAPTTPDSSTTTAPAADTTTPTAPATPAPAAGPSGTVNFAGQGRDFDAIAAWIQRIGADIPSFRDLWVPTASKSPSTAGSATDGTGGAPTTVTFTSTATITDKAKSKRADNYKLSTP